MVVDHDLALRVVVHGVDGEVAARGVLDLRAPHVVAQHAAVGVDDVRLARQLAPGRLLVAAHLVGRSRVHHGAESGHLDHLVVAPAAEHHVNDAKAPPDDEGAAKQRLHLFGRCVGGDIEVLRPQPKQQVAHRAADDVSLEARVGQRLHVLDGAFIDEREVDAVHLLRHLDALSAGMALRAVDRLAEQLVDELLDHVNRFRICQPRSRATASSAGDGLVATGSVARLSRGRSLSESL